MLDQACWQYKALSGRNRAEAARAMGAKRFYRGRISFSAERIVSLQAPRPKDSSLLAEYGVTAVREKKRSRSPARRFWRAGTLGYYLEAL